MKQRHTLMVAATIIVLSLSAGRAYGDVSTPRPPHVGLLATPLSQLHLAMSAQAVTRMMGEAAKATRVAGAETCTLEFSGPILGAVVLADGKVSRVTLDVFGFDKGNLPAFGRTAWP